MFYITKITHLKYKLYYNYELKKKHKFITVHVYIIMIIAYTTISKDKRCFLNSKRILIKKLTIYCSLTQATNFSRDTDSITIGIELCSIPQISEHWP